MKVTSLAFSIVAAAIVLSASGCGPAGDGVTIEQTSPQRVDLLERADPNTAPVLKALLQRGMVLYDESALAQDTVRVAEIDTLCQELETKLAETGLFASVEYTGAFDLLTELEPDEVLLVLSCEEEYSYDRAANATKAGLTGFFTLGLAPTKLKHGYESKMIIKATKSDGQAKEYESFTALDVGAAAYQNEFESKGHTAIERARRQVALNNAAYLIHQMIEDGSFFTGR